MSLDPKELAHLAADVAQATRTSYGEALDAITHTAEYENKIRADERDAMFGRIEERLRRLEVFADRLAGLMSAAGSVLDAVKLIQRDVRSRRPS